MTGRRKVVLSIIQVSFIMQNQKRNQKEPAVIYTIFREVNICKNELIKTEACAGRNVSTCWPNCHTTYKTSGRSSFQYSNIDIPNARWLWNKERQVCHHPRDSIITILNNIQKMKIKAYERANNRHTRKFPCPHMARRGKAIAAVGQSTDTRCELIRVKYIRHCCWQANILTSFSISTGTTCANVIAATLDSYHLLSSALAFLPTSASFMPSSRGRSVVRIGTAWS